MFLTTSKFERRAARTAAGVSRRPVSSGRTCSCVLRVWPCSPGARDAARRRRRRTRVMGTTSRRHFESALLGCIAALTCTAAGAQDAPFELPHYRRHLDPARGARAADAGARTRASGYARAHAYARGLRPTSAPATSPSSFPPASSPGRPSPARRRPSSPRPRSSVRPARRSRTCWRASPASRCAACSAASTARRPWSTCAASAPPRRNNTLVLINGRRINDLDLAGVDLSTIPRESIDHIEITRGNSGAVLYGDGAVGGVINIVTKTGVELAAVGARRRAPSARFAYARRRRVGQRSWGPGSASAYGNVVSSSGYRENNRLRQENGVGDLRYTGDQGSAYLNLSADDQRLGLPGGRLVTPTFSLVESDPRGATTPFDYGDKQGINATAGVTRIAGAGHRAIVDGGVRQKKQQAGFFSAFGSLLRFLRRHDTDHGVGDAAAGQQSQPRRRAGQAAHRCRRLRRGLRVGPRPASRQPAHSPLRSASVHHRRLCHGDARGAARYRSRLRHPRAANSISRRATSSIRMRLAGSCATPQGLPFDTHETQQAWHVGVEHRVNQYFALFARMAQSFRVPNVDERVGVGPFGMPTNFDLQARRPRATMKPDFGFASAASSCRRAPTS